MIGLGTALGLLYARIARLPLPVRGYRPGKREWLTALSLTLAMTLAGLALFWYELPANFAGLPFDQAMITTALGLLLDFSVYGVALAFAYRLLLPK
ncbi:MAG: hypothetical protein IMW89_15365 [Ktedonobacteraceae bacterium]|nr:hypothetical protein [Ktedonobacteraceae bacterium]